jgi:hypothetical protein
MLTGHIRSAQRHAAASMPKLQATEVAFLALVAISTAALVVFCGWRDSKALPPVTTDAAAIYRAMEQ